MLKVGITGGIGSGKSTVARIFEQLGIPVYYADKEAKVLMNDNEELKQKIIHHFGKDCYKNGQLDRSFLATQVFSNAEALATLNSLVHPITLKHAEVWLNHQTTPYAIKEAALIFESGGQEFLDVVLGVSAPKALRIQRSMKRDGSSREQVLSRMERQMDEEIKMRLCDYVIVNDGRTALLPQILMINNKLKSLAEKDN
jgi:dephospho-CoA kinase